MKNTEESRRGCCQTLGLPQSVGPAAAAPTRLPSLARGPGPLYEGPVIVVVSLLKFL